VEFGMLLVVAYVVEEVGVGLIRGKSLAESRPDLGGGTLAGIAAIAVIMCVALVLFFAFKEIRTRLWRSGIRRPDFQETAVPEGCEPKPAPV
jgi:hypothetical protein